MEVEKTYVLRIPGTRFHRIAGSLSDSMVPLQLLSTVDVAPVRMGIHDGLDESFVVNTGNATLDNLSWDSESGLGSCQSEQHGDLHIGLVNWKERIPAN